MPDETTSKREFGKLEAIPDNYPKYVVSLDERTNGSCPPASGRIPDALTAATESIATKAY